MKSSSFASALIAISAAPVLAGTSTAVAPITPAPEETSWQVRTAMYGWAQGLEGDIGIKDITTPVDIGFDDILENLDMAFMGLVEVNHGRWGFLADLNYAKISDSFATPAGYIAPSLKFEQKQFIGNFFLTYQAYKDDKMSLGIFGGVRVNSLDVNFTLGAISRSFDDTWVDPVIGARFQNELGGGFFFRAVGDIGGFGVSSDFTWQAMAALGYRTSENSSLLLGYRAIGTDYTNDGFTYDIVAHGLALGFEYTF
jgi:hypothetical protein